MLCRRKTIRKKFNVSLNKEIIHQFKPFKICHTASGMTSGVECWCRTACAVRVDCLIDRTWCRCRTACALRVDCLIGRTIHGILRANPALLRSLFLHNTLTVSVSDKLRTLLLSIYSDFQKKILVNKKMLLALNVVNSTCMKLARWSHLEGNFRVFFVLFLLDKNLH